MRVWILSRATGEPDWVESSCGVDVGITELKVGQMIKPVTVSAAPYLPPRSLRMHESLLRCLGLRPGLFPGACVRDKCIMLGPLVGVRIGERSDALVSMPVRRLLAANERIGCLLYFFQQEDVQYQAKSITGLAFSPTPGWESRNMPLPDVLYDQVSHVANDLRQYLLQAGVRPVNQILDGDAACILSNVSELREYQAERADACEALVLMQRDDLGIWHCSFQPETAQKAAVVRFCRAAVRELEKAAGCLGEVQLRLTLATTGRIYINRVDFIPEKRSLGDRAFRLPLLFSRRLAGFPLLHDS